MATYDYKKGNLINLFIYDTSAWRTFGHSTNNSLSTSSETTTVSSKDFGNWPATEVTGTTWSMSGEYLMTPADASIILGMQASGKPYSFAFGVVNETDWASGLKPVTDISVNTKWSVGSTFMRYGNGLVTSAEISAPNGEQATMTLEITGSGALSASAPANASILKWGV